MCVGGREGVRESVCRGGGRVCKCVLGGDCVSVLEGV